MIEDPYLKAWEKALKLKHYPDSRIERPMAVTISYQLGIMIVAGDMLRWERNPLTTAAALGQLKDAAETIRQMLVRHIVEHKPLYRFHRLHDAVAEEATDGQRL